jgi:hypothetical protein
VSDDSALNFALAHPVPGPDHAVLLSAYELLQRQAAACFPVRVRQEPGNLFLTDWELTRAAFMARMASTLRHLGYLAPSFSRLDGAALARTLLEHVVTFAWLSAGPAERLPRFLRKSFSWALDKHREMARHGEELLSADLVRLYNAYVREYTSDIPGLPRLCEEADAHWGPRIRAAEPPMQFPSFEELYRIVFDQFANLDHPSVTALQSFVHFEPGPPVCAVDGEPERGLRRDLQPYWIGLWSFAWALMVSSLAQGCPRLSDLKEALSQVRGLREYERHGLLAVTVADGITRIDVVPDADARIDEITREREGGANAP